VRMSNRRRCSSAAASRRWSVVQAQALLAELEQSGLNVEQFASEAGLRADRLRRWARRLRAAGQPLFVEVAAPRTRAVAVDVEDIGGAVTSQRRPQLRSSMTRCLTRCPARP
jgi:hypothetical protein